MSNQEQAQNKQFTQIEDLANWPELYNFAKLSHPRHIDIMLASAEKINELGEADNFIILVGQLLAGNVIVAVESLHDKERIDHEPLVHNIVRAAAIVMESKVDSLPGLDQLSALGQVTFLKRVLEPHYCENCQQHESILQIAWSAIMSETEQLDKLVNNLIAGKHEIFKLELPSLSPMFDEPLGLLINGAIEEAVTKLVEIRTGKEVEREHVNIQEAPTTIQ